MQFRSTLTNEDPARIEQLVTRAGVFHAGEIEIARDLAEETLQHGPAAGYEFLFADGPDRIDGYTCFGPIPGTDRRYELYWIAVDPSLQYSGVARALLQATEAAAAARGATHLFAESSGLPAYQPARAFYTRMGYTLHATVPDYHADGDGLLIFGKRL
jgi:ribosomal protein S18 acetylase RimI-like enzyme